MASLLAYDPERHAELLAHYCLSAQPGERLLVGASTAAAPLVAATSRALLRAGARPAVRLSYPGQDEDFAALAADAVLDEVPQGELDDMRGMDGSLRILTPEAAQPADAARAARLLASRAELAALRSQKKWSLTLYPTPHAAAQAGMTLAEFEDFVMRAMFLDRPDPVAAWGEVRELQARLIERLSRADVVRIEAPGTDLTLRVGGAFGRTATANATCRAARSSPARSKTAPRASLPSPCPPPTRDRRCAAPGWSSVPGRWWKRAPRKARRCCTLPWTPTPAPGDSASSASAPISAFSAASATFSSTRKSAARSTSPSARATPKPAA